MILQDTWHLAVRVLMLALVAFVVIYMHIKSSKKLRSEHSTAWNKRANEWHETASMYDDLARAYEHRDRVKYAEMTADRDRCLREMRRCEENARQVLLGKQTQACPKDSTKKDGVKCH